MQINRIFGVATFALMAAAVQPVSGATLIDDFSQPIPAVNVFIGPASNPQEVVTALGGGTSRTARFEVLSGLGFQSLVGGVGDGTFAAGFNALSTGLVRLTYTFGSSLDLSSEALLAIVSATQNSVPLGIVIQTSLGDLSLANNLAPSAGFASNNYLLANFTGTGNLAQVTGLVITATGASGSNFLLDSISATPTPEPVPRSRSSARLPRGRRR